MFKYLPIVWSGLWRNRLRSGLTLLTVIVAFAVFGLLRGFTAGYELLIDEDFADMLQTMPPYAAPGLPLGYLQQFEQIDNIKDISYAAGIGGYYQNPEQNFWANAVPNDGSWFRVLRNSVVDDETIAAFNKQRTAIIVGEDLFKEFGLSVGDRLPIIAPGQTGVAEWEFDVVGTWRVKDGSYEARGGFVHYEYVDERREGPQKGSVFGYVLSVQDTERISQTAEDIDLLFENAPVSTRTSTQYDFVHNYLNRITGLHRFINGVVLTGFLTILIVTGGTMLQSMRERVPEFAVMRAFGYPNAVIMGVTMAESVILSVLGAAIGLGLAQLAMPYLQPANAPPMQIPVLVIAWAGAIAVSVGVLASALPAIDVSRKRVVDALAGR